MKKVVINLKQVPVREFAQKKICDGHVFLVSKEGRKFYLMKPGVFVDSAFVKKYATQNTIFDINAVTNDEVKKQFVFVLKELRYLQFEKDLREKSFEIVKLFETFYSRDEHFLNFALACYEVFCDLPEQIVEKMHETDMYLFRKALYSASFAVIIGLSNEFYHPLLLKDLFNLTLVLDIGLCESDYSYYISQACNQENRKPGSGIEWLQTNKASEAEIKMMIGHPKRTYQFLKNNKNILTYPELAEIALYQHELSDGTGFPRGISKGMVSTWESVVILADSLVEIQDEYDFETRVLEYIYNFKNQKMTDLPVAKVYKKLCHSLKHFKTLKETGS